MWKWVTVLCLGMYATLMAFGGEGYNPEEVASVQVDTPKVLTVAPAPVDPVAAPAPEVASATDVATPSTTTQLPSPTAPASVEVSETPIEPIAPVADPITITAVPQANVVRPSTVEDDPKPQPEIWRVTGSRVNLRAAANGQAQIVGRTVRGDSAEIIEMLPSGWAKVYIIDSGIEAYMSADFISPTG